MDRRKHRIAAVLVFVLLVSILPSYPVKAQEEAYTGYGENFQSYLMTTYPEVLANPESYGSVKMVNQYKDNGIFQFALSAADSLIETGKAPDKEKYMEVLISIITTYDLECAGDVAEQKKKDNLKTAQDYALDIAQISADAVSVHFGLSEWGATVNGGASSKMASKISTAISGLSVAAENTEAWIDGLTDLETVCQNYTTYDTLLANIENSAEGELKEAAATLRTSMQETMDMRLDAYANISKENVENFGEFFFSDAMFQVLSESTEYASNPTFKAFVDGASATANLVVNIMESSWNLGEGIGTLIGNIAIGGEDLISRYIELMALDEMGNSLLKELQALEEEFYRVLGTEKEEEIVRKYVECAKLLLDCRTRGEYCVYSIVAEDAGLVSLFKWKNAQEAEEWYNHQIKTMDRINTVLDNLLVLKTGIISGKVCEAKDRSTPIENAKIIATLRGQTVETRTNSSGEYSLEAPVGYVRIHISADEHKDFDAYTDVELDQTTYVETFLMVDGEGEGTATGSINNALDGTGVGGVSLTIREGWNNTGIGDILDVISTDADGNYSVTLPVGNYTMYAEKEGYIANSVNIVVQEEDTPGQNGTITPEISDEKIRVVLRWNIEPRDLDSHIIGTLSSGSRFNVFYSHRSEYDGNTEVCNLDYDDTDSEGPETITLNPTTNQPYYYFVHRYEGEGTLASSGAGVKVYQGQERIAEYYVPTNLGAGDCWNVFAFANGEFIVRNTITDEPEYNYVGVTPEN